MMGIFAEVAKLADNKNSIQQTVVEILKKAIESEDRICLREIGEAIKKSFSHESYYNINNPVVRDDVLFYRKATEQLIKVLKENQELLSHFGNGDTPSQRAIDAVREIFFGLDFCFDDGESDPFIYSWYVYLETSDIFLAQKIYGGKDKEFFTKVKNEMPWVNPKHAAESYYSMVVRSGADKNKAVDLTVYMLKQVWGDEIDEEQIAKIVEFVTSSDD